MRLFVAVYPPVEAVNHLGAQVARLRVGAAAATGARVRLVDPANLARPGDRMDEADVEADRVVLDDYQGPEWPATELLLMRSQARSGRPRYERLAAWPL
ncbi:hypothetical protein [Micromonospora sp. NPDC005172]|uniref:hypothetical protein n=1 Tax=Micromonospora sp. NPDC005172 TaxID=3156867 RepID=UPI0033BB473D